VKPTPAVTCMEQLDTTMSDQGESGVFLKQGSGIRQRFQYALIVIAGTVHRSGNAVSFHIRIRIGFPKAFHLPNLHPDYMCRSQ